MNFITPWWKSAREAVASKAYDYGPLLYIPSSSLVETGPTAMLAALFFAKFKSNYYHNQIDVPISRDSKLSGDFKSPTG